MAPLVGSVNTTAALLTRLAVLILYPDGWTWLGAPTRRIGLALALDHHQAQLRGGILCEEGIPREQAGDKWGKRLLCPNHFIQLQF